jgi:hypothetical protein
LSFPQFAAFSAQFGLGTSIALSSPMQAHKPAPGWAELMVDTRGQVSVEYLVITMLSLGIMVGIAGLGLALASSHARARAVILSNTP